MPPRPLSIEGLWPRLLGCWRPGAPGSEPPRPPEGPGRRPRGGSVQWAQLRLQAPPGPGGGDSSQLHPGTRDGAEARPEAFATPPASRDKQVDCCPRTRLVPSGWWPERGDLGRAGLGTWPPAPSRTQGLRQPPARVFPTCQRAAAPGPASGLEVAAGVTRRPRGRPAARRGPGHVLWPHWKAVTETHRPWKGPAQHRSPLGCVGVAVPGQGVGTAWGQGDRRPRPSCPARGVPR